MSRRRKAVLVIDHVPYDIVQIDPHTVRLDSEYFARLLAVTTPEENSRGFWVGASRKQRYFVTVVNEWPHGSNLLFRAEAPAVLIMDDVADWFRANLSAIPELGYEILSISNF